MWSLKLYSTVRASRMHDTEWNGRYDFSKFPGNKKTDTFLWPDAFLTNGRRVLTISLITRKTRAIIYISIPLVWRKRQAKIVWTIWLKVTSSEYDGYGIIKWPQTHVTGWLPYEVVYGSSRYALIIWFSWSILATFLDIFYRGWV